MNDNIQKVMSKAIHDVTYLSNIKQQDIPKGMRQVQNHSEKDLIMKAIDNSVKTPPETKVSLSEIKKKNPWFLGKMFESGFPDASGREEG